ncbi:MAG: MBL fold metallo-hydrolase [Lentisphaerae bacterium]|nr:MBL fold metallo-hydrolase [Lentisphaerota bacterium]
MPSIKCIEVGPFQVNCYLIWGAQRQALVLDPGADAAMLQEALAAKQLTVAAYLLTHGHADHLSALAALQRHHPAPYLMHAADYRWAFAATNQIPPYYAVPQRPPTAAHLIQDDTLWSAADLTCQIITTPGHSPGGLCYHFATAAILFTGDTLFRGSVGRTDLPGGNGRLLNQSLKKLRRLPPATRLYPGHGPSSTLATELRSNPFLATED